MWQDYVLVPVPYGSVPAVVARLRAIGVQTPVRPALHAGQLVLRNLPPDAVGTVLHAAGITLPAATPAMRLSGRPVPDVPDCWCMRVQLATLGQGLLFLARSGDTLSPDVVASAMVARVDRNVYGAPVLALDTVTDTYVSMPLCARMQEPDQRCDIWCRRHRRCLLTTGRWS